MALLDLSRVTKALRILLRLGVANSEVWAPALPPTVTPLPPDKLLGGDDVLNFYLYHLAEEPHFKNQPPVGNSQPAVRFTPMALNLFYLLSTHTGAETDEGAYKAQLLMGCAIKTMHDFATLTGATTIFDPVSATDVNIFQAAGLDPDDRLRISLQPIPSEDAVNYWTAGEAPLRLSAYYQISVVMLESEPAQRRAPRDLSPVPRAIARRGPRLDASENSLTFTAPGEASPRTLELRPAEVPVGGTIRFVGSDLTGDSTTLAIRSALWPAAVEVDSVLWDVATGADKVYARIRPIADTSVVLPGIYGAIVKIRLQQPLPGGGTQEIVISSNEVPFCVTPAVTIPATLALGATGIVAAAVPLATVFQHPSIPTSPRDERSVKVFLGGALLGLRTAADPALQPGQFEIIDATTLHFMLPSGTPVGSVLPLRVLVNGTESPPWWIEVAP